MAVLVDTSVWIDGSRSNSRTSVQLKKMIEDGEPIFIIRPIQVEVCQGARAEEEFHKLWNAFLGFQSLQITDKHWGMSAWHFFKCRKRGFTVSTLDCLIATICREYQLPLWSFDKIFPKIQKIIGFEIY